MALGVSQRAEFDRLELFWRGHASAHTLVPQPSPSASQDVSAAPCPELDCVRDRLDPDTVASVEQRSAQIGVGADRVLVCAGAIDEETYLRELSDELGIGFEGLDWTPREQCPLSNARLIEAAAAGIVPLSVAGATVLVVAPRGLASRRLIEMSRQNPDFGKQLRLTTSDRLHRFVFRHANDAIGWHATTSLQVNQPEMSAAPPRW